MSTTILNRRATLFVARPMKITGENIPQYISAFSKLNLLPSVNRGIGIKITPKGVEPEDIISLDMKYLDETLKVSIGPDRLDIVSKRSGEDWDKFRDIIMQIVKAVKEELSNSVIRLAQCATAAIKLDQVHLQSSYSKIFLKSDDNPVEWSFRKVTRNIIQSSDNQYAVKVNNVCELSKANVSNIITISMDINTMINSDLNSLNNVQELFWVSSACTIEEAIKIYNNILSDEK